MLNMNNETGIAIRTLAEQGFKPKEISLKLGMSLSTVYNYSKGFNYAGLESHEDIRELRRAGVSVFDIKIITGKDPHTISSVCRKMGLGLTDEEYREERKRDSEQKTHSEDWARNYICEKSGGRLEYVSGYINMDSHLIVRCTYCGAEQERSMSGFRGTTYVRCCVCHFDERVEARRAKRQKDKENKIAEKETAKLIKAGSGKQLSFGFCACGEILSRFDGLKGKQCADCARRAANKYKELSRRRKLKNAMIDSDITIQKLFRRDNGVCYLCGCLCDWDDKEIRPDGTIVCGNTYPSIDHVKPLTKGGCHSWDNVKLAHRICNSLKADDYDEEDLEEPNNESDEGCRNLSAVI